MRCNAEGADDAAHDLAWIGRTRVDAQIAVLNPIEIGEIVEHEFQHFASLQQRGYVRVGLRRGGRAAQMLGGADEGGHRRAHLVVDAADNVGLGGRGGGRRLTFAQGRGLGLRLGGVGGDKAAPETDPDAEQQQDAYHRRQVMRIAGAVGDIVAERQAKQEQDDRQRAGERQRRRRAQRDRSVGEQPAEVDNGQGFAVPIRGQPEQSAQCATVNALHGSPDGVAADVRRAADSTG